jgi:mRNA interferase MazF
MRFEFGDVVLVPFPFTNQVTSKKRPAVVISSRQYGVSRPDIVVMAITSQMRTVAMPLSFGDTDVANWQAANLLKPSAVKPVVATLEQSLVIKQLGRLSAPDQAALKQTISTLIG